MLALGLLALSAPRYAVKNIGFSAENRPIVMHCFGSGPESVLIVGGIHGDEDPAISLTRRVSTRIANRADLQQGRTIFVIECANPDGYRRRTRVNANQVDLNRNFASNWKLTGRWTRYFSGLTPASEAETTVLMRAIDAVRPSRILCIRSPLSCIQWQGTGAKEIATSMHRQSRISLDHQDALTPGSLETFSAGLEIPSVTLQLSSQPTVNLNQAYERALDAFLLYPYKTNQGLAGIMAQRYSRAPLSGKRQWPLITKG